MEILTPSALHGATPLLCAREAEQAAIGAALDAAAGRPPRGTALFLQGAAGLGKTSLLSFAAWAARGRCTVVRAAGHELEQGYPFAVIHQVCEALRGRYGAALAEAGGGPESLRALFQRAAASPGTSARARSEVLYAVHWFLASAAEQAPLLLCLDDLHWSDPDSLEALRFLALRLAGLPLVIVGALRPWPPGPARAVERLRHHGAAAVWELRPLTLASSQELLTQVLGTRAAASRAPEAQRLTGGNPFLLRELARLWEAAGRDAHAAATLGALPADAAPDTPLILARLCDLPPPSLGLLQAASVLGTEFRLALALGMADLSGAKAEAALTPLRALGVIAPRAAGRAAFLHPLLCAAVAASLEPAVRHALHRAAVAWLRAEGAPPAERAPHLLQSAAPGDAQAVEELRAAAKEAALLGAHDTAAVQWGHAAALCPPGPTCAELLYERGRAYQMAGRQDLAGVDFAAVVAEPQAAATLRPRAYRAWGFSLALVGDTAAARQVFAQAVAAAAPGHPALAAEIAVAAAVLEMTTSDMGRALAAAEAACALARTSGDPAARARAQAVYSNVAFNLGRPEALEEAQRALDELPADAADETADLWGWSVPVALGMISMRAERYGEAETLLQAAAARARARGARSAQIWAATFLTELEWRRGRLRAAFAHSEAATLYPADIPWATAMSSSIRARLLLDMGDLAGAEACLTQGEDAAARAGLGLARLSCAWGRGVLHARRGEAAQAAACLLSAPRDALGAGQDPGNFRWRQEAAEALIRCGRWDEARALAAAMAADAVRLGRDGLAAAAQRCLGVLHGAQGRGAEAEAAFGQSLAIYGRVDEPLERARALLAWGIWLRRSGSAARARQVLDEAAATFAACGSPGWQAQAEAERRAAGGRRRAHPHGGELARLTPQEYRVGELVSQGLRNQRIACLLLISPNTLETHMRHIYAKLGVSGRPALAAYFAAHAAPRPEGRVGLEGPGPQTTS
jgi:DNA-binding CsgD family transcriptional regulator/tetratricopeptide (TPR) repeat protein